MAMIWLSACHIWNLKWMSRWLILKTGTEKYLEVISLKTEQCMMSWMMSVMKQICICAWRNKTKAWQTWSLFQNTQEWLGLSNINAMSFESKKKLQISSYGVEERGWNWENFVSHVKNLKAYMYQSLDERTKVYLILKGIIKPDCGHKCKSQQMQTRFWPCCGLFDKVHY